MMTTHERITGLRTEPATDYAHKRISRNASRMLPLIPEASYINVRLARILGRI